MKNELATQGNTSIVALPREQIDLIKKTVCKGASDAELQLFLYTAKKTGLDPLCKQIHAVRRYTKDGYVMSIQTGIDGYRLIAQRSRQYAGQQGPFWCGKDGKWCDVWLSKEYPAAAKVGVLRKGFAEPVWGVATWDAYAQTTKERAVVQMWDKMAANQLAKCAEALALRKAFPQELSGLYADDEMQQADSPPPTPDFGLQPVEAIPDNPPIDIPPEPIPRDEERVMVGTITDVLVKDGKTNGRAWTRYGVLLDTPQGERLLGTFAATLADKASCLIGTKARCGYEDASRGMFNCLSVEPIIEGANEPEPLLEQE